MENLIYVIIINELKMFCMKSSFSLFHFEKRRGFGVLVWGRSLTVQQQQRAGSADKMNGDMETDRDETEKKSSN